MDDVDDDVDGNGRTCIGAAVFDDSLSLSSLEAEQKCGSSTFTGITGDIYLIPIAISGSALTYIRALRLHCRAFNGQFTFNEEFWSEIALPRHPHRATTWLSD